MNSVTKTTSLGALGLPSGDHWVRFHVEEDSISFEIGASLPQQEELVAVESMPTVPTGFVQRWGGTASKLDSAEDSWLDHINEKHLK